MITSGMTQREHFLKYGYYDALQRAPSPEEAVAHAMEQIERAFGKKNNAR